jgi:hypothetical protein
LLTSTHVIVPHNNKVSYVQRIIKKEKFRTTLDLIERLRMSRNLKLILIIQASPWYRRFLLLRSHSCPLNCCFYALLLVVCPLKSGLYKWWWIVQENQSTFYYILSRDNLPEEILMACQGLDISSTLYIVYQLVYLRGFSHCSRKVSRQLHSNIGILQQIPRSSV